MESEGNAMVRAGLRFLPVLLFVLTGIGGFGIAPPARASGDDATLTVHSRFCPPGFSGETDIFATCHDNPGIQGISFQLQGAAWKTELPDGEGNLVFASLPAGVYSLSNSLPAAHQRPYVYCSPGDGSAGWQLDTELTDYAGYLAEISLDPGVSIICDWYTIPDTDLNAQRANITIHNRWCPVGYGGRDPFTDCHGNIGIELVTFTLTGPENRSGLIHQGNAAFSWLKPGIYSIDDDIGLNARVVCSLFSAPGDPFLDVWVTASDTLDFRIDPSDDVVCDWYTYPTDAFYRSGVAIPVLVIACTHDPGGWGPAVGSLPAGCHEVSGVRVRVYPTLAGASYSRSCVTAATNGCQVVAPYRIYLTAVIDESTLPAGWTPRENPQTTIQFGEFAVFVFVLLP